MLVKKTFTTAVLVVAQQHTQCRDYVHSSPIPLSLANTFTVKSIPFGNIPGQKINSPSLTIRHVSSWHKLNSPPRHHHPNNHRHPLRAEPVDWTERHPLCCTPLLHSPFLCLALRNKSSSALRVMYVDCRETIQFTNVIPSREDESEKFETVLITPKSLCISSAVIHRTAMLVRHKRCTQATESGLLIHPYFSVANNPWQRCIPNTATSDSNRHTSLECGWDLGIAVSLAPLPTCDTNMECGVASLLCVRNLHWASSSEESLWDPLTRALR